MSNARSVPLPTIPPKVLVTIGTQTGGNWLAQLEALGECSSLAVIKMGPIKDQFWVIFSRA